MVLVKHEKSGLYVSPHGVIFGKKGRPLKPVSNATGGYHKVTGAGNRSFRIHRLVAETFIPKKPSDKPLEVNHKSGDKSDNSVNNLEWVTSTENKRHYHDVLKGNKCVEA